MQICSHDMYYYASIYYVSRCFLQYVFTISLNTTARDWGASQISLPVHRSAHTASSHVVDEEWGGAPEIGQRDAGGGLVRLLPLHLLLLVGQVRLVCALLRRPLRVCRDLALSAKMAAFLVRHRERRGVLHHRHARVALAHRTHRHVVSGVHHHGRNGVARLLRNRTPVLLGTAHSHRLPLVAKEWRILEVPLQGLHLLLRQRLLVVGVVFRLLPLKLLLVEERAEALARAPLLALVEIPADDGLEITGVVELLLRTVRVRTAEAVRASSLIRRRTILLLPVWARTRTVADARVTPGILVVVRVDAGLPVVLNPDRAPMDLEALREELRGQLHLLLLLLGEERRRDLFAAMSEGAEVLPPAVFHVRVIRAQPELLHGAVLRVWLRRGRGLRRPSVVDHHGRSLGGLAQVWLRLLLAVLQN